MEIDRVAPLDRLGAVERALALAAAAEALATVTVPSIGSPQAATAAGVVPGASTSTVPDAPLPADARLDKGAQTGVVQAMARPPLASAALPAPATMPASSLAADVAAAPAGAATGDFQLPADQLVNASVIGLTIDRAAGWPLQRRTPPPDGEAPRGRVEPDTGRDAPWDDEPPPEADTDEAPPAPEPASARRPPVEDEAAGAWAEPLSRALREAQRHRPVPRALQAALEQWQLGRCVLLACPRGDDPAGSAWAHVLWPRAGSRKGLPLALTGTRLEARITWTRVPTEPLWCHARVMKEQHPRQGRQLVALDAKGTAAVACEVQLGPLPLRTPRWREACVRIDAVRRLWAALGDQWSVTVVVASRRLA